MSLTKVAVQATIEFFDYKDGSEEHYALLESPGDGWTCEQGEVVSIWVDASGNPVADQGNPPAGAVQKNYFAVQVPNGEIVGASGSPTIDFVLTPPAGVEVRDGDPFELNTGAWAHEKPTDSGELSLSNNDAYDFGKVTGQHEVPKLEVSMSWAYESGRGDKHDPSSSHTPPAGLVGNGSEAAVTFSVPAGSEVNEITLDVSGWTYGDASADARGTLEYNGAALTPDSNGKITITVNPAGSQVTCPI